MSVELDEADFCVPEDGNPEEVVTAASVQGNAPSAPAQGPRQPYTSNNAYPRAAASNENQTSRPTPPPQQRPQPNAMAPHQAPGAPSNGNAQEPVAFFSAKAVNQLPESSLQAQGINQLAVPQAQLLFNPKAESPSIRKTSGIDHNSSRPVARNGQHVPPPASQTSPAVTSNTSSFTPVRPGSVGPQAGRGNVVNPSLDHARRIGAPGGPGSPLSNRGSYRPPSMKRPLVGETNAQGGPRPPLADVPANRTGAGAGVVAASDLEAKRQKMA